MQTTTGTFKNDELSMSFYKKTVYPPINCNKSY